MLVIIYLDGEHLIAGVMCILLEGGIICTHLVRGFCLISENSS